MTSLQTLLATACDDIGEVKFRSYSGRGMYGAQCVAITGDSSACMRVLTAVNCAILQEVFETAIDADPDSSTSVTEAYDLNDQAHEAMELLGSWSQDNMGLDVVLYWPSLPWIEASPPSDA